MGLPGHGETNDQPKTSSCVGPGLSHRISCRRTDVTLGNRWLAYQVPHGPAPPNGWPAVLVFHGPYTSRRTFHPTLHYSRA